ncbi:MAG TPA: hypothetical protein PKN21_09030, partial [Bacteroidales bacterium]|nr:hypothetical protein [Bacteroidales bacterium]
VNDDWIKNRFRGWQLHHESILGQMLHNNVGPNHKYFTQAFYSERSGVVDSVYTLRNRNYVRVSDTAAAVKASSDFEFKAKNQLVVKPGDYVKKGDVLFTGSVVNKVFFVDISRFLLTLIFVLIGATVYFAYRKRLRENRI